MYGSSGAPSGKTEDLGGFAPGGQPKNLNVRGGASADGVDDDAADAALRELGAGLTKRVKITSLAADGTSIGIPKEGGAGRSAY